jgi:phosphate transport system substrate-binding protein
MVNLAQAWAENYAQVCPDVSVQVAGGGSGVGIAGLIDGFVDIATSSRRMEPDEIADAMERNGVEPVEFIVGYDALAVYVHKSNPLESLSLEELAEVYGEGGTIEKWSQLGANHPSCETDQIIRVSRQNNSGTYHYFRETVVGKGRDFKLGSIDQSGSKDVVALVARTPCAIGYSGMAYATTDVKMLAISLGKGTEVVQATRENAASGAYPITRPLFVYTSGEPSGIVKDFIDWVLSPAGREIIDEIGYVSPPAP